MSARIDKLPKAERLAMVDKRIKNIENGAGDWPLNTRNEEIDRLFAMRAIIVQEKE